MNVISGTHALSNGKVWIWIEHIVAMKVHPNGGALIYTLDGRTIALDDKAEDVIKTLKSMVEAPR